MHILFAKELLLLQEKIMMNMTKNWLLKVMLRLFLAFISYITNIDNAEDLDIVIPMCNLLEYSKSYSKISDSLCNYYRDEPNSGLGGDDNSIDYSIKD